MDVITDPEGPKMVPQVLCVSAAGHHILPLILLHSPWTSMLRGILALRAHCALLLD